jgi:carbamate kinase
VVRLPDGSIKGIEAVIDKDRASALLAVRLAAHTLVITTGTDGVYKDFLTDNRTLLRNVTIDELNALAEQGQFPPGSMGPKIKAADRFLRYGTGERVIICRPEHVVEAMRGEVGTLITRS